MTFLLFFIRMSLLCLLSQCRNWTWLPFKAFSKCLNHFPQFLKIIPIIIPPIMGFKIYENKHPTSKLNPSKKKLRQNPQVAQVDLKMGPPTCYPHDTPTMCYPFMTSVKPCYPSWTTPRLPLKPPSLFHMNSYTEA